MGPFGEEGGGRCPVVCPMSTSKGYQSAFKLQRRLWGTLIFKMYMLHGRCPYNEHTQQSALARARTQHTPRVWYSQDFRRQVAFPRARHQLVRHRRGLDQAPRISTSLQGPSPRHFGRS